MPLTRSSGATPSTIVFAEAKFGLKIGPWRNDPRDKRGTRTVTTLTTMTERLATAGTLLLAVLPLVAFSAFARVKMSPAGACSPGRWARTTS